MWSSLDFGVHRPAFWQSVCRITSVCRMSSSHPKSSSSSCCRLIASRFAAAFHLSRESINCPFVRDIGRSRSFERSLSSGTVISWSATRPCSCRSYGGAIATGVHESVTRQTTAWHVSRMQPKRSWGRPASLTPNRLFRLFGSRVSTSAPLTGRHRPRLWKAAKEKEGTPRKHKGEAQREVVALEGREHLGTAWELCLSVLEWGHSGRSSETANTSTVSGRRRDEMQRQCDSRTLSPSASQTRTLVTPDIGSWQMRTAFADQTTAFRLPSAAAIPCGHGVPVPPRMSCKHTCSPSLWVLG
eukprot:m.206886 g.206886  ORF g.206886 m.206886 type:complete len:300 (-) comp15438_c0_seq3:251-1150(-)